MEHPPHGVVIFSIELLKSLAGTGALYPNCGRYGQTATDDPTVSKTTVATRCPLGEALN